MEMIRSIPHPLVTESRCPPAQDITAEYLRSVLHYDPETGIFTWRVSTARRIEVGDVAGGCGIHGYLVIKAQKRLYLAHRLAWLYVRGEWPKASIDHINRVKTDNRISNLRDVSHAQNHQNRDKPSNNLSGHIGVHRHKLTGKWQAQVTHNQETFYLGLFENLEDAIAARKAGELKYWGHHRAD